MDVVALAAARAYTKASVRPQRAVIFDTDWWSDVDDAVAVRLLCHAERLGLVDLKAAVIDTKYAKGPGALGALLAHEGRNGVTIGAHPSYVPSGSSPSYQTNLFDKWPHPDSSFWAATPSALTVYRTVLAAAAPGSVDIISVGYLTNLADLLASSADGISSLTGAQLVAAKVRHLWVMGGRWPAGGENNFNRDATARTAANAVVSSWPAPTGWTSAAAPYVTFLGYGTGLLRTGANLSGLTATDALSAALADHGTANSVSTATIGRNSWDPMLTWLACLGDPTTAGYTTVRGSAAVDGTTGANTFSTSSTGPHRYVKRAQPPAWFISDLNARLVKGSTLPVAPAPLSVATRTPVTTGSLATNLVVHLHADDIDSSIADTAAVPALDDRMRAHAVQQSSSGSRPTATTAGGLRALHFTGSQWMSTDLIEWLDSLTLYAKVRWTTLPSGTNQVAAAIGGTGGAPSDDRCVWLRGGTTALAEGVAWAGGGTTGTTGTAGSLVVNTWHVIAVRISPTSVETFLDGTSGGSVTSPSQNMAVRPLTIGSRFSDSASDALSADVREVRAYNVTHDNATVAAVVAAMAG